MASPYFLVNSGQPLTWPPPWQPGGLHGGKPHQPKPNIDIDIQGIEYRYRIVRISISIFKISNIHDIHIDIQDIDIVIQDMDIDIQDIDIDIQNIDIE